MPCSNQQLPGYEKQASVFKEHGIDEIYCMSVNDSFVMNAWAQDQKLENVKTLSFSTTIYSFRHLIYQ